MGQTATIVITDLVGSTRLRAELGEDAADRLRSDHDARLGAVAEAHGGNVVKGMGDGLIISFAGATEALHACVGLQQALHAMSRRTGVPLAMRIGVSAGDVTFDAGDCFGTPVIEAARLCAIAGDGQVLVADLVRLLARGRGGIEFTETFERVLKGLPEPVTVHALAWEPGAPGRIDLMAPSPYVGRESEISRLSEAYEAAARGSGSMVLVSGEAGIGKSRLIDQFCRLVAEPAGATVLVGGCHDGDVVANSAFVDALLRWGRSLGSDALLDALGPEAAVIVRLVSGLGALLPSVGEPLPVPPEAEAARVRDAVCQVLLRSAARSPLVLVLDDLHWADAATVAMLRAVGRSTRNARVLVIATYRDTDLDRRHPFAEALGTIQREAEPSRIALAGLSAASVRDLLSELADQEVTEELARVLADETEGNPFFVRETVAHLLEEGRVRHDGTQWVLDAEPGNLGVPAGVRDVIGRRLSRLPADTNRLLAIGALSEVAMSLPIVAAVAEIEAGAALDALDGAIAAGIVRPTSLFDEYCFTHALFRHVLVEEMNPSRQVRFHRAIADEMERTLAGPVTPVQAATLLRHYERSATLPGAHAGVAHALAVADDAARRFAPQEEHAAIGTALDLAEPDDPRVRLLRERFARAAVVAAVPIDEAVAAAGVAADLVEVESGADAACDFLAELALDAYTGDDIDVPWTIAELAVPRLRPERHDVPACIIRCSVLNKADHDDPQHPGIIRDTPERRRLRADMLALPPKAFGALYVPVGSRAEALAVLAHEVPDSVDDHGVAQVSWGPLWALGSHRALIADGEAVIDDAIARGWVVPAVSTLAMTARLYAVLGEHDAADAALAQGFGLMDRVPETTNAAFQLLGAQMLIQVVRGHHADADALASMLPYAELPATSWAGLALRSAYVSALAQAGRVDDALDALQPVLDVADIAPGYAPNYPLVMSTCIEALWAMDRTDGLDRLEDNLRRKVVEPDVRYPEVDGRWSMALAAGLTGRIDDAHAWFEKARAVMVEQGTTPLLVAIDLDEATLGLRLDTAESRKQAIVLVERAAAAASHPVMSAWLPRIAAVADRLT